MPIMKKLNGETGSGGLAPSARCGRLVQGLLAGVALVLAAGMTLLSSETASAGNCGPPAPDQPWFVTGDCVDPHYTQPYVDLIEERTDPVPHTYVHGGFNDPGNDTRFSFYFPPAAQYEERFFQNTHQLITSENAADSLIEFAIASGAYYVQTNIGGNEHCTTAECAIFGGLDPSIGGYRANAEAAKFSRVVAASAQVYGYDHRPYGYLNGGSGGAYQTLCSAEHTDGVWDGYVPFVMGSPHSIPNMFTVRIHALRVLRQRNKFPEIMDAIDPGGSGDPYATLNEEEAGALREATLLGFPPRGWWNHATLTGGPLSLVAGYVPFLDPTYEDDFFSKPGYLGFDDPYGSVAAARIVDAPNARTVLSTAGLLVVDSIPAGDLTGIDVVFDTGVKAGDKESALIVVPVPLPSPPFPPGSLAYGLVLFGADLTGVVPGVDKVHFDNSRYLALQTYHRHQVPHEKEFYAWDQFRGPDGTPIYPQRDVLTGPEGAYNGAGCINDGDFHGKMIVLENLMDIDALPWQADWYRTKVKEALGRKFRKNFRLWFNDHAQHVSPGDNPAALARTVSYQGILQQAQRDVSAWVEDGKPPPASTVYHVDDETQVQVPGLALLRGGIQPVVHLWANGGERADVAVGDTVEFFAVIGVPLGTGKLVAAEWDFEGEGTYPVVEDLHPKPYVILHASHTYTQSGTYYPVLRATSQREGDPDTPWTRVQNLGRVRVVVE